MINGITLVHIRLDLTNTMMTVLDDFKSFVYYVIVLFFPFIQIKLMMMLQVDQNHLLVNIFHFQLILL
jgi:hypothetical protein